MQIQSTGISCYLRWHTSNVFLLIYEHCIEATEKDDKPPTRLAAGLSSSLFLRASSVLRTLETDRHLTPGWKAGLLKRSCWNWGFLRSILDPCLDSKDIPNLEAILLKFELWMRLQTACRECCALLMWTESQLREADGLEVKICPEMTLGSVGWEPG